MKTRVKEFRLQKGMTQQQLADKLNVTKATVSAYETNAKYPSIEVLINIATLFNVSADYLLGLSETSKFENQQLTDEQNLLISEMVKQFIHLNSIAQKNIILKL